MSIPLDVRTLRPGEVAFLKHLVDAEGWSTTRDELERLLAYEPGGCFLARVEGVPAGTVTSTRYGRLGWIGFLIVEPRFRGRGAGEALMRAALASLEEGGVHTVRLDATAAGEPLYRRLGFVAEQRSLRLRRPAAPGPPPAAPETAALETAAPETTVPDVHVVPATLADLAPIAALDQMAFGANRRRVLARVLEACPPFAFLARGGASAPGDCAGYILGRRSETAVRLGPWVVRPGPNAPRVAEGLLRAALAAAVPASPDGTVQIGVLADQRASLRLLARFGFEEAYASLRMRRGPDAHRGAPAALYAIGCAGKG